MTHVDTTTTLERRATITVRVRHAYGQTYVDPVCIVATMLCGLSEKRTFTGRALELVRDLGYEVNMVDRAGRPCPFTWPSNH